MIVEQSRLEAKEKDVELIFDSSEEDAVVMSRSNTLVGVFDNVIRNAIHYTPHSSAIWVSLTKRKDAFWMSIKDSGPGVEDENLKGIFEPFFRTCEARNRESGGYGLGLAIAQRTILLHGGTIEARNCKPTGLEILISLPALDLID